ncbi:hypothetical protein J5834_03035 [bacterium]|nr:hypothetical protein [bacterium]
MKKIFLSLFILAFTFIVSADAANEKLLASKTQALAIGELSLAYRLVTLSMSLSAAKAVDPDYIDAILKEVESTLKNGKQIQQTKNAAPNAMDKKIYDVTDHLLGCSRNVKIFSRSQTPANMNAVKKCIDESLQKIDELNASFNFVNSLNNSEAK